MATATCTVPDCVMPVHGHGLCSGHRGRIRRTGDVQAHIPLRRRSRPLEERFWEKVHKTDACWIWIAGVNRHGYGKFGRGGDKGPTVGAHRISWEITAGPVPEGLFVCHTCDMPPCVNPEHLYLGTPQENSGDMVARGRHPRDVAYAFAESHGNRRLDLDKVAEIRSLAAGGLSSVQIAKRFSVSDVSINRIVRGRAWSVDPSVAGRAAEKWAASTPRWDWVEVRAAAIREHRLAS